MILEIENDFLNDGFVNLISFWDKDEIQLFLETFLDLLKMQSQKLGLELNSKHDNFYDELDSIAIQLNQYDPAALDFVIQMLDKTKPAKKISQNDHFTQMVSKILGCEEKRLLIDGPQILVNFPQNKTRLATWHTESNWHPKRRNFVNTWSPLVRPKTKDSGTLYVIKKSHKKKWDFCECYGFDKNSINDKSLFNLQYEIPAQEIEHLEQIPVELNPNDLCLFHQDCIHSGSINTTKKPTYAMAIKIFDFTKDLTLSGNHGERLYQYGKKDIPTGRPGLKTARY